MNNYSVYLGSSCQRDYQESVFHVKDEASLLHDQNYEYNEKNSLEKITNYKNNPLGQMHSLGRCYEAIASINLLEQQDILSFKLNAYIGSKLKILGAAGKGLNWYGGFNTACFFLPIMSDNSDLIEFLIQHRNDFQGEYKRTDTYRFFLKNTLLALAGDWNILKERAELFLNEPKKQKRDEKRIPDHEFYVGLCNQSIPEMETALNKLLEPKLAKWAVYDNNVWFDFYLQMQVLMYAKIAAIHGFDLNIDSPIAPKELIEYKPLEKYEDPYDFMKEFDYNKPLQEWIDMWQERMRIAKENEEKKKKGFFSWFKK